MESDPVATTSSLDFVAAGIGPFVQVARPDGVTFDKSESVSMVVDAVNNVTDNADDDVADGGRVAVGQGVDVVSKGVDDRVERSMELDSLFAGDRDVLPLFVFPPPYREEAQSGT